jgi:hypothetical protein
MSLIGDLGDPKKDVAAIEPLADKEVAALGVILNALADKLMDRAEGLRITIDISRKPPVVESPK